MDFSLLTFSMQTERLRLSMNADTLASIAAKNGIRKLDLMTSEIALYGQKNLQNAFAANGVACDCVIAALPFYRGYAGYEKKLRKAIALCRGIGARFLMIVPGSMDKQACAAMPREQLLSRAIEAYRTAVKAADGLTVVFENTPQAHKPLCSPADCRAVLDAVPGLGFVFDTGNFEITGRPDGDRLESLLSAYALLKDRIVRVHGKDVVRGAFPTGEACADGTRIRCVMTGAGVIPMRAFVEALQRDGYDGTFSIEYAAPKGVKGIGHAKILAGYVQALKAYGSGEPLCPPYGSIAGVEKPVSRIVFGTAIKPMLMGKNADAILDAALSVGINTFDCARGYGLAEKSLGAWIAARNNRERVVLITKCGNVGAGGKVAVNRAVIESELQKSLAALGTDYIDLYLLHRDDPKTPVAELIDTLNEQVRAGRIRAFGVSNWTLERIEAANAYAAEHGLLGFAASSPNYGLARQMTDPWGGACVTVAGPENAAVRARYASLGLPVIAYSSLGRGFFTGRFASGDWDAAKKILDGPAEKGYLYPENMRRLANAERLAAALSASVSDVALRYVFASDMNVFAVCSSTDPKRLAANVRSACRPLTAAQAEALERDDETQIG